LFAQPNYSMNAARSLLNPLSCIDPAVLLVYPRRMELLGAAALLGTMDAAWRGFSPALQRLADRAASAPAPAGGALAQMVRAAMLASGGDPAGAAAAASLAAGAGMQWSAAADAVRRRAEAESEARVHADLPAVVVSGGSLPLALTGRATKAVVARGSLRGPLQQLDDGEAITASEAWMWAQVNPLGPSGSGRRSVPK
jgi:hypothetical protein